jgi:hypothetical protein
VTGGLRIGRLRIGNGMPLPRGLPLLALTLLLACSGAAPPTPGAGADPITFGVLGASCDAGRAAAMRRAGVQYVEFAVGWDRFEPADGVYDPGYLAEVTGKLQACRSAGLKIVLGLGLQYPPQWVRGLPGGTFTGPTGAGSPGREVDLVFSGPVRHAVQGYLDRLAADVGWADVVAVRVGTNGTGEFGYPGPDDVGNRYWAFGPAPQQGVELAAGMSVSPLPGWTPGQSTWRGQPVTEQAAADWYSWYSLSLVGAVGWQIDRLRDAGFTGRFHVPVAGLGVQPADLRNAVAGRLDGRGDPDGALGRGLHYTDQFPLLAELDRRSGGNRIDIDFTGIDDGTAVRARALDPPQDGCRPDDVDGLLTRPGTALWSAQRWTVANAHRVGLPVIGENPGPPGMAFTGGSGWSDPSAEQLRRAGRYAPGCGLHTFLWAFEDQLFAPGSGVSLDEYARWISAAAPRS